MSGISPSVAVSPGVRHIIDNGKYPEYIRHHPVFKNLTKIVKVFPGIGLPNITEDCDYSNLIDARQHATNLINVDIKTQLTHVYNALYSFPNGKAAYQAVSAIYTEVVNYYPLIIQEDGGKVVLKFHRDCGTWENKAFARQGESVFKVYNKIIEICKGLGIKEPIALESLQYFKSFSTANVPGGKKYKIVFSSTGAEGAWDIATISMRGISSCQSWGSSQSRGLIGSISSKYVGVAYITSGEIFSTDTGSKMLRRAMVRFCINKTTKKPALLVDRIYPADDQTARKTFSDFLASKTKLPILFPNDPAWTQYYLPNDDFKQVTFQPNEFTYMDTKIPFKSALPPKDYTPYYNRIAQLDNAIMVKVHNSILKKFGEYSADRKMHRNEFRGGVANLILSMKKHLSGANAVTYLSHFLPKAYSSISAGSLAVIRADKYETGQEYERAIIKGIFKNIKVFEAWSKDASNRMGKWMKFYTESSPKLFQLVWREYKKEMVAAYKDLLRE